MNFWNAVAIGLKEIWAHKFRSMLTMLGIILGVSSLIAMAALIKGMENGMKQALIQIGGIQKIRIVEQDVPLEQQNMADQATGCTMSDVTALKASAPMIEMVTPEMRMRGTFTLAGRSINPFNVVGTWPSALVMNQHHVEYGRMFNEIDDQNARSVCVIGTTIRDALFGSPEDTGEPVIPVGQTVFINGVPFTIIGMFEHYESDLEKKKRIAAALAAAAHPDDPKSKGPKRQSYGNRGANFVYASKNSTVYIPLNTVWVKFRAASGFNDIPDPRLSSIQIRVADVDRFKPAMQQARNVLMSTHNGIEDFAFITQEDWAESINSAIRNARFSGGIIAGISLLVGGIGIMNIMLASITERIREVGLRKAIGATGPDIFIQVLIESVVIAIIGGFAGLGCSFLLVKLLIFMSPVDNTPVITLWSMIPAFVASVLVGVLAGLIPAFRASRLNPIEALRYE